MPSVTKADVIDSLAVHNADVLRSVLEEARVRTGSDESARGLATRIAQALWWHYCTPLGFVADRTTLDHMVDHVARRLAPDEILPQRDAWTRLAHLSSALVAKAGPVALEDLPHHVRVRMMPSWKRTLGLAGGATGSLGAFATGRGILFVSRTTVGRLLPFLPTVGPIIGGVYKGGRIAAAAGGPLSVTLSVLAANNALSTNYLRVVPLLLGIGSLGVRAVQEAEVVPAPS
jgi:hypothetical protein